MVQQIKDLRRFTYDSRAAHESQEIATTGRAVPGIAQFIVRVRLEQRKNLNKQLSFSRFLVILSSRCHAHGSAWVCSS